MGSVVIFPRHARASTDSAGYKSGRNSDRDMPDTRSTASTRNGGTSSHCNTACLDMPSALAILVKPPTFSIARSKASFMDAMSSTPSQVSQAPLHLPGQALLYSAAMTLGDRIARARRAKNWSLQGLADKMRVSRQLVWQWEHDETDPRKHAERLCELLEVPYGYFYGDEPKSDSIEDKIRRLAPANRLAIEAAIDAMLAQQPSSRRIAK